MSIIISLSKVAVKPIHGQIPRIARERGAPEFDVNFAEGEVRKVRRAAVCAIACQQFPTGCCIVRY